MEWIQKSNPKIMFWLRPCIGGAIPRGTMVSFGLSLSNPLEPIQYNTISFIEDDKNKDREVSADTAATETYYMMEINKI